MRTAALLVWTMVAALALAGPSLADNDGRVGNAAPAFELKDLTGRTHTLEALRQQGHVLLVFWATECVYCHAMLADFTRLHNEHGGRGLAVVGINVGAEHDVEVAEYARRYEVRYLLLVDRVRNLDVGEAYGVAGTPTLVLVAPSGEILYYGHRLPDVARWLTPADRAGTKHAG